MVPTAIVPMLLYMSGRRPVVVSTAFILGVFFSHWGRRVAVAVLILLGMLLVVDGIHWLTQQSPLLA